MFSREIEDGINFFSCRSLSQWAKACSYLSKKKKKKKKKRSCDRSFSRYCVDFKHVSV